MGNTQAIGRRRRVLRHANRRAQRRFHEAIESGVIFDETAIATRRYVEAERLVDRLIAPEAHPTPVEVVVASLLGVEIVGRDDDDGWAARGQEVVDFVVRERVAEYESKIDEYQTRGA